MALHGGRAVEAEAFFRMDLDLARSLGDRRGEAIVLANLAESLAQQGRVPEARRAADDALDVAEELRDPVVEGFALVAAGSAARADGEHDEAGERALAAEERFRAAGMAGGIAHARLDLSRARAAAGDRRGAIGAAVGAARAARAARSGALEIEALLDVQAAISEAGDEARAARFLRRAQDAALREGLEEWMDRIRRRLARQAASWARTGTQLRVRLEAGAGFLAGRGTVPQTLQVEGFLGQGRSPWSCWCATSRPAGASRSSASTTARPGCRRSPGGSGTSSPRSRRWRRARSSRARSATGPTRGSPCS